MTQDVTSVFWFHHDDGGFLPDDKCVISLPQESQRARLKEILKPVVGNKMVLVYTDHNLSDHWLVLVPKMASEMVCFTLAVTAAYLATIPDQVILDTSPKELVKMAEATIKQRHSWFSRHDHKTDFDHRFAEFLVQRTRHSLTEPPTP